MVIQGKNTKADMAADSQISRERTQLQTEARILGDSLKLDKSVLNRDAKRLAAEARDVGGLPASRGKAKAQRTKSARGYSSQKPPRFVPHGD